MCEFFFKGGAVVALIQKCSASLKHQVKVVNNVLSKTTFQANEHAVWSDQESKIEERKKRSYNNIHSFSAVAVAEREQVGWPDFRHIDSHIDVEWSGFIINGEWLTSNAIHAKMGMEFVGQCQPKKPTISKEKVRTAPVAYARNMLRARHRNIVYRGSPFINQTLVVKNTLWLVGCCYYNLKVNQWQECMAQK